MDEVGVNEWYDPIHPEFVAAQRRFVDGASAKQAFIIRPNQMPGNWARRLFRPVPKHWGYRGDPWLWRELRETLALVDAPGSASELQDLVRLAIEELTGVDIWVTDERHVEVARYPWGTAGYYVAPEKWRDELAPLLLDRFHKTCE